MKKSLIPAFMALLASSANAVDNPFYVKAAAGWSLPDAGKYESNFDEDFSGTLGYSITFGYRWKPFLALETGKVDLGKSDADYHFSRSYSWTDEYDGTVYKGEADYSGFYRLDAESIVLGALFSKEIGTNLTAGFRLGMHQWNLGPRYHGRSNGTDYVYDAEGNLLEKYEYSHGYPQTNSDSNHDPYYGATIDWSIRDWAVSFEHTIYEIEDRKPSLSAIALSYNF